MYDFELEIPGVPWSRRRKIVMSGAAFVIMFSGALEKSCHWKLAS